MTIPGVDLERAVAVPMRDGCRLASDIYRPDRAGPPRPVIVLRTPYGRGFATQANLAHPAWYARRGFIVVVQDVRGRFDSEGDFEPFVHEAVDGHDTIEWAARIEGSNGRVGTYGASYAGYIQFLAAATQPPSLGAICPTISGFDLRDGMLFTNGVFELAFGAWWAALLATESARRTENRTLDRALRAFAGDPDKAYPLSSPADVLPEAPETAFYRSWLARRADDGYWSAISARAVCERIEVPALHVTGWWDAFVDGSLEAYHQLAARGAAEQQLVIGPWSHAPWAARIGAADYGEPADRRFVDERLAAFLERHLAAGGEEGGEGEAAGRGGPARQEPRVRYFRLGDNAWHTASDWPPRTVSPRAWRLASDGDAASRGGNGRLVGTPGWRARDTGIDYIAHDAAGPVPGIGGRSCCFQDIAPIGPRDQAFVEQRRDVLVYTSRRVAADLLLEGPVRASLWLACDAPTADVVARLCVVEGRTSTNLVEGVVRVPPGGWPEGGFRLVEVDLGSTAALVRAGSRLRLHVTGSAFPRFELNPQSAVPPGIAQPWDRAAATFALAHGPDHPSEVRLPVVRRTLAARR